MSAPVSKKIRLGPLPAIIQGMKMLQGGRRWVGSLMLMAWIGVAGLTGAAQTSGPLVLHMTIDRAITPAMAEYLDRALGAAQSRGAAALIVELDTPGGAIDSMNRMVESIRASQVPVIVYVAPRGAMAASAGTVITMAGHVAAMAPETAIGAASPVGGSGENLPTTEETKQKEILKATIRSLAANRPPGAVSLAEATIDQAKAVSADEALQAGMVDVIALDIPDLVHQLDGRSFVGPAGVETFHLANAQIEEFNPSFIENLLAALTDPNIVFLLLTIGVQAILIEIASPGGWVAGFVGVVCLALAGYGLGFLPVNWFGLIFIAMAFVLFVLDIKAPTHGALTAAGLASLIIGGLVLFNSPGTPAFERVSVPLVLITSLLTSAAFFTVVVFAVRAQRRPVEVGREALVGEVGRVAARLEPAGMVQVAGELWSAELEDDSAVLDPGARVEVVAVKGLRLRVRPLPRDELTL
jgi:membrane-bound serine protease (ClpP class)